MGRSRVLCPKRGRSGSSRPSRRKKAKVRVREPKIDGCEIFWRLNLQTREFADWMRVHDQKRKFDREDRTVVRGIKRSHRDRRDTQASVFPLDRPESARASVPSAAFHIFRGAWGPTEGVSTGMSAYTTPVRDGAGHMVMAPTPPTNIRNLIAQKEKVRV